jgi:predicted MFS family arabinose efflux permease
MFIVSITTVTPQLMLPLVGDLAPPERRATALSLVVSGAILGMLIARLISGIVTNYVSWRVVFWIAFGIQYLILILLYLFMPDYPATNPGSFNYLAILWSTITIAYRNPIIVQACLIGFFTAATFTSYWTTVTFLLAGPPYGYSPLVIGLFALVGIGSMCFGPTYSRYIIDRIAPLHSTILGLLVCLLGVAIGTYTGTFTVAGPIIQAFAVDLGLQSTQISNRSAIYSVNPKARNRINTIYMVSVFFGQLMGTAAGNNLYARSGWIGSGSGSVGFLGAALVIAALRGPRETGWVGWRGGWSWRRTPLPPPATEGDQVPSVEPEGTLPVASSTASDSREKVSTTPEQEVENGDVEKGI